MYERRSSSRVKHLEVAVGITGIRPAAQKTQRDEQVVRLARQLVPMEHQT